MSLTTVLEAVGAEPLEGEFLDEVLDRRLDRCGELTRKAAGRSLELLEAAVRESGEDPELIETLVVVAIAWPRLAARRDLDVAALGRRAALLFEQADEPDRARALLEALADADPDDRGIDRDLTALLRRTGDVDELARRYTERAQVEIDAGRPLEAVPWLQEVLLADPGRKDIARLIRDLRYDDADRRDRRRTLRRRVTAAGVLLALLLGAGWREYSLRSEFQALLAGGPLDRAGLVQRLDDLQSFDRRHAVWHGSIAVGQEVGRVYAAIESIDRKTTAELAAAEAARALRLERAEEARLEGRRLVERGRLHEAVATFERALSLGGAEWDHAERIQRDLDAVQALIEEEQVR